MSLAYEIDVCDVWNLRVNWNGYCLNWLHLICFVSSNYTNNDDEMRFCVRYDVCEDPMVVWIG